MDVVIKILSIVQICALVFGLLYATKGIKTKNDEMVRKGHYRRAGIYIGVYLLMNVLRLFLS